ncbi:glycosyltransferase 87 family protein [Nocardioides currus]|uniref:glycosyltransferase 87 family protein n=1 Tax=Nocardioides currus TaxID=2133958 RepID=UPI00140303EC|nr:glycosyltransferase 87 family protein [Nocardioides currus]
MTATSGSRSRAPYLWLLVATLLTVASAVQKLPCLRGKVDTDVLATAQCYSDIPLFYDGRGLAADFGWLGHLNPGFRDLEYPPIINLFIEASAKLTHVVLGIPSAELDRRASLSSAELYDLPGMAGEERAFFLVTCALLLVAVLATVWIAWRFGWAVGDPVSWAVVAPLVVLTLTVNWDAIAVLATALALVAWQRDRLAWFGVFVALGTATKLFPLVLLAAALILVTRSRPRSASAMVVAFLVTTVATNAPLYLSNPEAWREFWDTNTNRPASFGSAWMALRMVGTTVGADELSLVLGGGMLAAWVVLGALTWRRLIEPTFIELSFVFLVVFFVLGKVYSPQYSLWVVLGLLLVTRSRWLVTLVAAAETWHYVTTWLYLRGITTPDAGIDKTYWSSIAIRLAVEAFAVVVVLEHARRRARQVRSVPALAVTVR